MPTGAITHNQYGHWFRPGRLGSSRRFSRKLYGEWGKTVLIFLVRFFRRLSRIGVYHPIPLIHGKSLYSDLTESSRVEKRLNRTWIWKVEYVIILEARKVGGSGAQRCAWATQIPLFKMMTTAKATVNAEFNLGEISRRICTDSSIDSRYSESCLSGLVMSSDLPSRRR